MFGDYCFTYIPNNIAPNWTFTEAMNKLKQVSVELKGNPGRETQE